MRVVVSVKPIPGGGQASQAARYIANSDRDEDREGKDPRRLFSAKDNSLSFWKAERVLTEGRAPAKDEVIHITISFREEDFERLGADEASRQDALKEVSREAITEITGELRAVDMLWVAGIHRNTDHPHIHLLFHRGYLDHETGREKWLTRLPEEMLPHRAGDENGVQKIHLGSFSQAFETALDRAQERARQTVQTREQAGNGLVAENFLRENHQRDVALSLHRADPESHPKPETPPLSARERNLLFFGRAPEHHTPEMRELRHFWGLSRTERAERVKALREGPLAPSPVLKDMVEELESRRTLPAIRHYQATILNEEMRSPGSLDLRRMFERLPPNERTFLIEPAEEKKQSIARSQPPTRDTTGVPSQVIPSSAARPFASIPRESNSYREYMASMGAIESRLLNEAVRQRQKDSGHIVITREGNPLSITEARALLPQEEQVRIRERARNLAWEQLAPPEVFATEPEPAALRLSDTVAHLQEETQQRARVAHQALNEFARAKIGFNGGKETLSADSAPKLAPADTERLNALKDYAARMREELYRGFESLDSLPREIEKHRSHDEIGRNQQAELEQNREQVLPLNGHSAGPALQLANGAYFEAERNSTAEERAGSRESTPWMVDSDQKWHFDSVRDLAEPTPVQATNDNLERVHDHDFGHDR